MTQLVTKATALALVGLVLLLLLIALLFVRYDAEVGEAQGWVEHTYQVLGNIDHLALDLADAESSERGYLLTGRDDYLDPYNTDRERSGSLLDTLRYLTSDNPRQQERLRRLSPLVQQRFEVSARLIALRQSGGEDAVKAVIGSGQRRALMQSIRGVVDDMTAEEDGLLRERLATAANLRRITLAIVAGGGVMALLFLALAATMARRARTEQQFAEARLRESLKMRALGELTGGVAHDFNNLLTVIGGNFEIIQTRLGADHPAARFAAAGLRAAQRGATLTAQLLAFGRRQPLAPVAIDLNSMVGEMTGGMLQRTLGESVRVQFFAGAALWPAFADRAQVESAVLNLALNARDAMPDGGKLTIETANATLDAAYAEANEEVAPGQYVMIGVSDTGTGMPPEVVARAFEPFYTTKAEGKGSGLGLAMVHGFAKQSHGHVKIYSELGQGTTVKLYLPRAAGPAIDEPVTAIALPTGSGTILVVEDDADVRRIAVGQLQELGYSVIEAADAEAGLKAFRAATKIDLLLTDVVLPGPMRGKELAAEIARLDPAVRILFMSGYTENAIVHDGRLDEGVMLLSKPFRREDIAVKVARVLAPGQSGR